MEQTILVVDKDSAIRRLINLMLTSAGYRVREARDGRSALDQIATTPPNLVLTDQMLPDMTGDVLAAQVTQRPDPIPSIIMSVYHRDSRLRHVTFLAKPFALLDLVQLVAMRLHGNLPKRRVGSA